MKPILPLLLIAALLFQTAIGQNTSPYWSLSGNANASASSKLGTTNSIPLRLLTKNVERLRIDTLGRVGVGLTSPGAKFSVLNSGSNPSSAWGSSILPLFQGYGENTSGSADYIVSMASNTASARTVFIGKRSRGTLAAPTMVSNNDYLLTLRSSGHDGKTFHNNAAIEFSVDGTPTAGSVPARIAFATGSTGSNRANRLVIGSTGNINFNSGQLYIQKATGNVGIGTTAPATGRKLHVTGKSVFMDLPNDYVYDESPNDQNYGITVKSINGGLYAVSVRSESNSLYGSGIGVEGRGSTGVQGTGNIGIKGIGNDDEAGGIGVYGYTSALGIGVKGESSDGAGVFAKGGDAGINAVGGEIGGNFWSTNGNGINAKGPQYAGFFEGNIYTTGVVYQSSDKNLKQNIQEFDDAMDIINKLKPRHYEFKTDDPKLATLHLPKGKHYGLIAQDVAEVLPNLVKVVDNVVSEPNATDSAQVGASNVKAAKPKRETLQSKAVNYIELIPIMVKGMQEQEAENKELKQQLLNQQEQIAELRQMVLDLKSGNSGTLTNTGAYLEQNTPNPVSGTTVIRYQVPETVSVARLTLTNAAGQLIKALPITNRGAGQVRLTTTMLAAGAYTYSLWLDGRQVDSKRLIIAQ